jgi:hypothetical protein
LKQHASTQFETKAVRHLHRSILLEEEHHPLPDDPRPAALIARVSKRVNQARAEISDCQHAGCSCLRPAAAHLIAASAAAITAIVHMHPMCCGVEPTYLKDELLKTIDGYVAEVISSDELFGSAKLEDLFGPCSEDLCRAFESLSAEQQSSVALERAALALWNVANAATVAAADIVQRETDLK